jgi:hypothetical protein
VSDLVARQRFLSCVLKDIMANDTMLGAWMGTDDRFGPSSMGDVIDVMNAVTAGSMAEKRKSF